MTYSAYEVSTYDGSPVELYEFNDGVRYAWRYTNASSEIVYGTYMYSPLAITRGKIEQSAGEAPSMFEVRVPHDCELAKQFVGYMPPYPIGLRVLRRHLTDSAAEYVAVFSGTIASSRFDDNLCTLSSRAVLASLSRTAPWLTYLRTCNWALFSTGCGVADGLFRLTGLVSEVSGSRVSSSTFGTRADGWFTSGWMVRQSTSELRFIVNHVGINIDLQAPFANLAAGEQVSVYAGCDRSMATCASKFNNLARHAGWPDVPSKNPFAQNVFGYET